MKKICFLLLPVAVLLASVISCSSAPQNSESASANAALDNIFARKSVRTYLNKGVEKEKIDLMLRAGMAAPSGKDLRPWEFYVITERASLDSMAAALPYAKMLTEARYAIVVHNRGLDFVFPVFGFLHEANLLDDDMRIPFHCSAPPFCQLFAMPVM